MNPVYNKKYKIGISDSDFTGKIKLSSVFNFFQESASTHAGILGAGFDKLKSGSNLTWILAKIRVDIDSYPLWEDEIEIETWPLSPKGVQFPRDFLLKDFKGNILAKGTSYWVVVDALTHDLKRPDSISLNYPGLREKALDASLKKINPTGEKVFSHEIKIGCSQLDLNGHINNSKYIDFIMDCFDMEHLRKYTAKSIQVSYINEAFAGDTISVFKYISPENEKTVYVEGINKRDEKLIFTSHINMN